MLDATTACHAYSVGRKIFQGGCGTVFKGRKTNGGGPVAIKVCPASVAAKEVKNLEAVGPHPCIVPAPVVTSIWMRDADEAPPSTTRMGALVYPLFAGDALDFVDPDGDIDTRMVFAAKVAVRVLNALTYMHARGFTHNDVKPENILVPARHPELAVLADFGLMTPADKPMKGRRGTQSYFSPELIQWHAARGGATPIDRCACDVWALGITVGVMALGCLACDVLDRAEKLGRGPATAALQAFLALALRTDPARRGTAAQLSVAVACWLAAAQEPPHIPSPTIMQEVRQRRWASA